MIGSWFGTAHDVAPQHLDLPAAVTGGQHPAVAVVDNVVRGSGIVGRVTGDAGAVAVRLRPGPEPVRVTVAVSLDEISTRWWADRVRPPRTRGERPRLVLVHSQGALRGALVLARGQGWLRGVPAAGTVTFDLDPAELADGLLVVELTPAGALPAAVAGRFSGNDAIGLRIDRIDARPAAGPAPVFRSAGAGFAVAAPGAREVRLPRAAGPAAPPPARAPGNRWTRQKPARAAWKVLRTGRRVAYRGAAVVARPALPAAPHAVDLATGADVPVTVAGRDAGGLHLTLGPATGPVLVG
ncbi:hypothetical protein [Spirilliplanes yamanashiensis]|uniref:Uncharacterized protein n=1 Tax=Spirilliplanes yamanashiensis TaxID=42233 RepID=A0A8J3Y5T0_9ACTN|nr:hypothetical protein [Spirilliplanes yamanashiensis]MDP9819190.1 hypothetical protein [Spirilliplanes yamanashiensis]GIJ01987.1 hypothetical protein Sya03_13390 [Spirilliplanes yamanashiensis]